MARRWLSELDAELAKADLLKGQSVVNLVSDQQQQTDRQNRNDVGPQGELGFRF